MTNIVDLMVDFIILIFSAVIGFAIYYATNTTGWDTTVVSIWQLLPLIFIGIGILALVIKIKYIKK